MAKKSGAQVVLRGRFPKGTSVELVEVKDETVLRSAGGKVVDSTTVGDDGEVRFTAKKGQRYFIRGYVDGFLREVRATGRTDADDASVLGQPPVQPDPVRLPGGQPVRDIDNEKREKTPGFEVQPAVRQDQVPDDVIQRSDTPLGAGTPILDGENEVLPYPKQEDVEKGVIQRSDTQTGQATPVGPWENIGQQDAPKGMVQRSDTPYGVLTPIPDGDAVDATAAVQAPDAKAQAEPAAVLEDLGDEPIEAEGQSALSPLTDPDADVEVGENATDDQSGLVPNSRTSLASGGDDGKPLAGQALKDRAKELDISGRGSMSADQLRKAVAKAQK